MIVPSQTAVAINEPAEGELEVVNLPQSIGEVTVEILDPATGDNITITVPSDTGAVITQDASGDIQVENPPESSGTIEVEFQGTVIVLEAGETVETSPRGLKEFAIEEHPESLDRLVDEQCADRVIADDLPWVLERSPEPGGDVRGPRLGEAHGEVARQPPRDRVRA